MGWLATVAAAVITALATITVGMLARSIPRELRRAQALTEQLAALEKESPAALLVKTLRDDQLIAWSLRTIIVPTSWSQRIAWILMGAGSCLAALALVPMVLGIVAQINGHTNEAATLMTLLFSGAGLIILVAAMPLAAKHTKLVQEKNQEFRTKWGLPDELRITTSEGSAPSPSLPREYR